MARKRLSSQSCTHSQTQLRDHIERSNRICSTSHNSQWLCQSTKTKLPVGMCTANVTEKSSDSGKNVCNSGISQQVISSTKAGEKMAPSNRSQCSQQSFNSSNIQNGNRGADKKLHLQRGVGSFCRSYRRVFSHPYSPKISKPTSVSCRGRSFQFRALPFGIATAPLEFTRVVKEVKLMLQNRGIRIHQYLDDWLLRAPTQQICMEQSKQLVEFVQELGWVINFKKSELTPTQKFDFLGYRFDLVKGEVLPTEKKWQILKNAIEGLDNSVTTTPRMLMSFIGILAALEKTVPMGRLHMRPFQWYLKTHWRYPQSLDKIIPCSQILKKHLIWWKDPKNVLTGSPLYAEEHNLLLFTDASVKGWGAHLGDLTVSGLWSDRETNLHINILELKAVFLAIRSFQSHLLKKKVLVASDNSTVVAYLNKQGGTHSLEMCLMLWRLMAFCHPRAILLRARHIQGCLNVIADSLSRRDKVIQTEWSLHPKIFLRICQIWHKPMIDLFATKMNNKLPLYVSPVPDPNAMAVDALNISWEAMDGYVYCPRALIPKVVQKMRSYACQMIVVARDELVLGSHRPFHKPPLFLPHWEWLLKQPFSQKFHQNLPYLNLHVWHLDSRPNHLKNSQAQWQRELRHLGDFHPEGSMNQGGPFLNHGVKRSRWNLNNHLFPQ